ncbi:MAG: tetratricopeptide repeat protein [Candidatus Magnetomorum sp.]|nr:tetratricopeptide repeat protein [Candidatus Magnetomorum sp.]
MTASLLKKYSLDIFLIFVIVVCTVGAYYPVRWHGFISFDDPLYILDNPYIQNGLTWENLRWAFFSTRGGSWHPLTWISHMMDISWYGRDAGGHHWTNLQIHVISAILLFIFFRLSIKKIWISAAITACFALHPLHVESVAWVSERKDVLSVCFAHLTLVTYVWYAHRTLFYRKILVLFCFCLSLMSKPMMVTLPFLMWAIDYWPLNRWQFLCAKDLIKEKIIFLFPAFIVACVTVFSQKIEGAMTLVNELPLYYRILNAGVTYFLYIWKMFIPTGLSIFYPHPGITISAIHSAFAWGGIMIICLTASCFRKTVPFFFTGTVWFFLTLLPVIGIVQVGTQQMADRYTYFPMTGCAIVLFFCFSAGFHQMIEKFRRTDLSNNKTQLLPSMHCSKQSWVRDNFLKFRPLMTLSNIKLFLFILLITGLFLTTWRQVNIWQNDLTLFTHALNHTSNNIVAHISIADDCMKKNQISQAIDHYQKAILIRPYNTKAWLNLGKAYQKIKRYDLAIHAYQTILQVNPNDLDAHVNLGNLFAQHEHQYEKALEHYQMAFNKTPNNPVILNNIGNIEMHQNHLYKALYWYIQAIHADSTYIYTFKNLAILIDTAPAQFSEELLEQCVRKLKDQKQASSYFIKLSQIFEANKKESLASFFKQKAALYGKQQTNDD